MIALCAMLRNLHTALPTQITPLRNNTSQKPGNSITGHIATGNLKTGHIERNFEIESLDLYTSLQEMGKMMTLPLVIPFRFYMAYPGYIITFGIFSL